MSLQEWVPAFAGIQARRGMPAQLTVTGLVGVPMVQPGDDLAAITLASFTGQDFLKKLDGFRDYLDQEMPDAITFLYRASEILSAYAERSSVMEQPSPADAPQSAAGAPQPVPGRSCDRPIAPGRVQKSGSSGAPRLRWQGSAQYLLICQLVLD